MALLIGGTRQIGSTGVTITVNTPNITVASGSELMGPEIILAANKDITLAKGASVIQSMGSIPQGGLYPNLPLLIGSSTTSGSGNGVLLAVSDVADNVVRTGVSAVQPAGIGLTIGAGATISGANVNLNSTSGGTLDQTAMIKGETVSISAGTINLLLNPNATPVASGINLAGTSLTSLLGSGALSLTGYNSIDIYGSSTAPGSITSISSGNLALHTGALRGFVDAGETITINATSFTLDNSGGQIGSGPNTGTVVQGTLSVKAGTIYTGNNTTNIDQFSNVNLTAANGLVLQNQMSTGATTVTPGGITSQTNLTTNHADYHRCGTGHANHNRCRWSAQYPRSGGRWRWKRSHGFGRFGRNAHPRRPGSY